MRQVALVILCLCCASSLLRSQALEDVRLSEDIPENLLPSDIRIEAAGEIAGARLVVWGTTVDDGTGKVVNVLMMNLNGEQRLLTSAGARPYGMVGIVPMKDRFLVLWNDGRASAPGVHARSILGDGQFGGPEYLFSVGAVASDRVYWWSGANGVLVFWNDVRTGQSETRMAVVNGEGNGVREERNLGTGTIVANQVYRTDTGHLVIGRGSAVGYVVQPDGRLDERLLSAGFLDGACYLDGDSAIAVFRDTTFRYFASMFDSVPIWQVDFPRNSSISGARVLSKDSLGWFLMGHRFGFDTRYGIVGYVITDKVVRFDSNGIYADEWNEGCNGGLERESHIEAPSGSLTFTEVQRQPNNFYSVRVGYAGSYGITVDRSPDRYGFSGVCRYSIDSNGIRVPYVPLPPTSLSPLILTRISSDSISSVKVQWLPSSESIVVSVPVFSRSANIGPRRPIISLYDDNLHVGWAMIGYKLVSARNVDLVHQHKPQLDYGAGWSHYDRPMLQCSNGGGCANVSYWTKVQGGGSDSERVTVSRAIVSQLTPDKWQHLWFSEIDHVGSTVWLPQPALAAYNPNTESMTTIFRYGEASATQNTADYRLLSNRLGDSAAYEWSIGSPVLNAPVPFNSREHYVPINDSAGLLVMPDGIVYSCSSGGSNKSLSLPAQGSAKCIAVQRLYGERFLRVLLHETTLSATVELYDLKGRRLAEKHLSDRIDASEVFVVQNPTNHSIAFLWGGREGVRCTVLGSGLENRYGDMGEILSDVGVSSTRDSTAHPAGIFRNDTLFVVWEDFRNGPDSDIYGTAMKIPIPRTITTSPIRIASVAPNPAVGEAIIAIESGERWVSQIALYDALGRRVLDQEVILMDGLGTYRLDVSQLSNGSYEVEVKAGTSVGHARLIVLGQ